MPPIVEPQIAKAMPRSRPENVALISDSVVGSTMAPPMPWIRRAPISSGPDCAKTASRLAAAKAPAPVTNRRRLPY